MKGVVMATATTLPDGTGEGLAAPAGPPLAEGGGWARLQLTLTVAARVYRAFLLTLVVAALAPMAFSWSSYLVRSGSMEPTIAVGDVVAARPLAKSERVPVGRVMIFSNPARPRGHELLVHRVVSDLGNGTFLTRGDANVANDSTPVGRDRFRARASLLVPYVGLPFMWLTTGQLPLLVLWLLLTGAAFVLASRSSLLGPRADGDGDGGSGDEGEDAGPESGMPARHRRAWARRVPSSSTPAARGVRLHRLVPPAVLVLATALAWTGTGAGTAMAAFSSRTVNGSSAWKVGTALAQPYTTAVLADDPDAFYLLDEAGGTSAADRSGNSSAATYAAVTAYRQPGALTARNFGYSLRLGGTTDRLVADASDSNPTTFSLELWFRTTTTKGGKLIGFESTRNATSSTYDRHVFMSNDGRLVYGGWSSLLTQRLTSPNAYNDGAWHHLVVTAKPTLLAQSSVMYVDGSAVAAGATTYTSSYTGYWRVGYGALGTGSGYPTSAGFAGSIDDVAIYPTQLSAARVAAHYTAR
jgi:signal peptidase I